jgi:N-methylhydantoinase A
VTNSGNEREWLVGIDVGGTFTDGVLVRPGAEPVAVKSPTRLDDPVAGLLGCVDRLAEQAGHSRGDLLRRTAKFGYGTTQAANMIVEGAGARTGFITTRGFRDTLVIAGIGRDRIGPDLTGQRAESLVPRHLIHEVSERVDAQGNELTPLDLGDVRAAMRALEAEGVEAVGICLLWSFRDDEHERRVAELIRAETGWFVSASAECAPLIGEYERSATTALNARLGPPIRDHLLAVGEHLAGDGLAARPLIMTSAGGLLTLPDAAARPVTLLSSGPAGGVLACRMLAEAMDVDNVICADMGGTTFDVSLINDGEPSRQDRGVYAGQEIITSAIDIVSVGAGGGSAAWAERGTRLKVGPRSAGAFPGPACYGRGGRLATVTDANLLLGHINPTGMTGSGLTLDAGAARDVLANLGAEIGLDTEATAAGVLDVVDAAMADAIHSQTTAKGLDPRDYTLFAFGGGGALHAATIARELGIRRVVVPALAPVFSAYGVVASDIQHVLARSVPVRIDAVDEIAGAVADLERTGERNLELDGVPLDRRSLTRSGKLRFKGQLHAVEVPLPPGRLDEAALAQVAKDFVARYERLFGAGTSSPGAGIELVTLTVRATGAMERPAERPVNAPRVRRAPDARRPAWSGRAFVPAALYAGPLAPGTAFDGPAVVDQPGGTVWVPPDVSAEVDGSGNLIMEVD